MPQDFQKVISSIDKRLHQIETPSKPFTTLTIGSGSDPAFQNSWVNFGSGFTGATVWKDPNGLVHLEGMVKSGTVGASGVIFTLPDGWRPQTTKYFPTISNGVIGTLEIQSDGDCIALAGSNVSFSLEGVTFQFYYTIS